MITRCAPRRRAAASMVLASGLAAPAFAQPAYFEALQPGGNEFGFARCISADGSIIAGDVSDQFGPSRAARWVYPGPTLTSIGFFMGQSTSVDFLSRDGQTIYGGSGAGPFRWTAPGPIVADPDGRTLDVTPDGAVRIVSNKRQVGANAPVNLGPPPGYESELLRAIDASGTVIIGDGVRVEPGMGYGSSDTEFREASRWTEFGGWQSLGFLLGDAYSTGLFISDNGAVMVGTSQSDEDGDPRTWRIENNGPMTDLGTLPGFEGQPIEPVDMSADGSVIIGTINSSPTRHFVWTQAEGMRDLEQLLRDSGQDLDEWQLFSLHALSADGQYAIGTGVAPGDQVRSFIAPLFATCAPPVAPLADSYTIIAQFNETAIGEPGNPVYDVLHNVPAPNLAPDGTAAHVAALSNSTTALFVGPPPSTARIDDAAPGGGFFNAFIRTIARTNSVMLDAIAGDRALFSGPPTGGALQQVVRFTGALSGMIDAPLHNNNGRTAFIGLLTTGGFSFFAGVPGSGTSYPISAATFAPFPPDTAFTTPSLCAFNDSDQIALTEAIDYVGISPSADSCIMVRAPGQTSDQIRAIEGQQAPDLAPGTFLGDLTHVDVSMNLGGRIAFRCSLSTGGSAIFADSDSGLRLIAHTGMQAPGEAPGVTFSFIESPLINDAGLVVFSAMLDLPGDDSVQTIWAAPAGAPMHVVFRAGGTAPGLPVCRKIYSIDAPIFLNNAGQVLIPISTLAAGGTTLRPALYIADPARGPILIASQTATLPLAPADNREVRQLDIISTASASTSMGAPVTLSDDGHALFLATFTDDSRALVRARVAPPSPPLCPGDANDDGVVNFADITNVLTNFLSSGPEGDANHDGIVNFADITAVLTFFNVPCP